MPNLPALQITNESEVHARGLAPLSEDVIDPDSFDLAPAPRPGWERPELFSLERRSLLMFSKTHMRIVFHDLKLLRKFSAFLVEHRPESVPLLVYHLDARKALAAIKYTNAVSDRLKLLGSLDFTKEPTPRTVNDILRKKAEASFEVLANEDLPAWITSVWMKAVEVSIRRRINGSLPSQLRECVFRRHRIMTSCFPACSGDTDDEWLIVCRRASQRLSSSQTLLVTIILFSSLRKVRVFVLISPSIP